MSRPGLLLLESLERGRDSLEITFAVDRRRFRKRYRWRDVDLEDLERRHGRQALEQIYFHIAAFEAIPMVSLRPQRLDFGAYERLASPALERLWRRVLRGVGAQWRWQNGLGGDPGPAWNAGGDDGPAPARLETGPVANLCFNGGGKDSLVALRLLERAGLAYATLGYSHSSYGGERLQHDLIAGLERHCRPTASHRQWVEDELWDEPAAVARDYGVRGLIVCETPISVFAALPLALAHGYPYLVLANERSADEGSFTWIETGEEVNHQWGKSAEAERLLDRYIGRHLVAGGRYFSLLKPIWDVLIFNLLRAEGAAARDTHSCSVRKPWCESCPKCAYVGASFLAYLDPEVTADLFAGNLFDREANLVHYRGLLGLGRRKPFDCVGEIGEMRLAFELCRRRGSRGRALELWTREGPGIDLEATLERHLQVDAEASRLPAEIARPVLPVLRTAAVEARGFIESWF